MRCFNDAEGPQWKHSMFGNPNDPETFRSVTVWWQPNNYLSVKLKY